MSDALSRYKPIPTEPPTFAPRPATIAETWTASRTIQGADNTNANDVRMERAYAPVLDAINEQRRREGLRPLGNPVHGIRTLDPGQAATNAYGQAVTANVGQEAAQRDVAAELARIRRRDPKFLPGVGDTPEKIMMPVIERDKRERAAAQETLSRSEGIANTVVGFAGSVSKSLEDPVVIATLPLGGGGRTVVGIAAREFALNFLTTGAMQGQVAENRAVLGEDMTAGEMLGNALTAGVAGGVLGGGIAAGIRGTAKLGPAWDGAMGRVYDALPEPLQAKWRDATVLPDAALPEIADAVVGDRMTPDLRAALNVVQRNVDIEATTPFAPGARNAEAHEDRLAETLRRIADGNPMPTPSTRSALRSGTALDRGTVADVGVGRSAAEPEMAGYMRAVRVAESSGYDLAKAKTSSAYGRYQFTRGTWLRYYVKRFGREGLSDADILGKRADGGVQDTLMRDLSADNAAALRRAGHPPTSANLYLSHFAGPADAARVLNAADDMPVASLVRRESVAANPFLAKMTAGDLRRWAARKVGGKPGAITADVAEAAPPARFDDLDAEAARLDGEMAQAVEAGKRWAPDDTHLAAWADAVEQLRAARGGEVQGALFHPDVGPIDLVYGNAKGGFAHIEADHPDMLAELPVRIAGMMTESVSDNRIVLQGGGYRAIVRRDLDGDPQRWLLTAYERPDRPGAPPATTEYRRVEADGQDGSPAQGGDADVAMRAGEDNVVVPFDDYDAVAPLLAAEPPAIDTIGPAAAGRFDPDDALWTAIDRADADDAIVAARPASTLTVDPTLAKFDDPHGADAAAVTDSVIHDLTQLAEAEPGTMVRISEDGDEQSLSEVLAAINDDDAMIAAVKGCL